MIAAGYVVRRLRWLNAEADASLLKLTLNLLFPAFVVDHLLGATGVKGSTFLLAVAAGALFVLLGIGAAYLAAGLVGMRDRRRRTFGLAAGLQNYGFIPLPILIALFDSETVAVHLMHTVGVELMLWTAGVMLVTGGQSKGLRNLANAPLITTLACLATNVIAPTAALPSFVSSGIGLLSACAVPVALLLIGATIRDLLREREASTDRGRPAAEMAAAVGVRMVALPALILCFAKFVPMPSELQQVLVVQAAMPGAVYPILLARRYGGDAATAVRVALATTFVSVLSIPKVVAFGLWWTGAVG